MADNVINMSEQDILNDFLCSQKHITDTYNTWAGECVNPNLRDDFLVYLKRGARDSVGAFYRDAESWLVSDKTGRTAGAG